MALTLVELWYDGNSNTVQAKAAGGGAYLIGLRSRRISQHAIFTQVAGWIAIVAVILMMFYVLQAEWRDWMMGGVAELAPF